jgi:HSP20 family molecular chaperone IbpA
MFFATTTTPASFRHSLNSPVARSLERFLSEAQLTSQRKSCAVEQDEKFYTLSFDVPGIAKDQLTIAIEGSIVRIETQEGAPRQYKSAYELPQEIDIGSSEAKLENGVLTLKLGKHVPANRVTTLQIH